MRNFVKRNLVSVIILCLALSTVTYAAIASPVYKDASDQLVDVNVISEFGEMSITGGGVYTINTTNVWHAYTGFSQDANETSANLIYNGSVTDTDIAVYATNDGGASTIVTTSSTHGLSLDDIITITNTTNYNDIYKVIEVPDTTNFVINKAWDTNDDGVGTFTRGNNFEVNGAGMGDGTYLILVSAGGSSTAADTYGFGVVCGSDVEHFVPRKFPINDVGSWSVNGMCIATTGTKMWFVVRNITGTADIDIDEITFSIHKQ